MMESFDDYLAEYIENAPADELAEFARNREGIVRASDYFAMLSDPVELLEDDDA